MLIDNPGPTGTNHDSPFVLFAEHRITAQQAQLDRARQLVEQYRNTQDLDEMVALQTELLTILNGHDHDSHDDNMVIAARFTGAIWREAGIVINPELIGELFSRFGLAVELEKESHMEEIKHIDDGRIVIFHNRRRRSE